MPYSSWEVPFALAMCHRCYGEAAGWLQAGYSRL